MRWSEQSRSCRVFLTVAYLASLPAAYSCFAIEGSYTSAWILVSVTSVFVATVSVRLPKISSVISMGDVFIILCLLNFGPGPALVTYWVDIIAAHFADVLRQYGARVRGKILLHRFVFNLSCCAMSVWAMYWSHAAVFELGYSPAITLGISLGVIAITWFCVNTTTVSFAIAFWMRRPFWEVWREGLHLYLLNFLGSAATAGLVMSFKDTVGLSAFFFTVPIAVVLFQLYRFYISKYDQAQEHIGELNKLYLQTVEALAAAVDAKDRYTHGHIRRVQVYAVELARHLGLRDDEQLVALRAGALLHDIGKIAIPEYILNKPSTLTEGEYERMKLHPLIGANMLRNIDFAYPVVPLVRSHHERWDGTGYPDGLSAEHIPLGARILSLVDCYDALTTHRPYRSPMPRAEVIKFFLREAGKAYDPTVVNVFLNNLEAIERCGQELALSKEDVWAIPEGAMPTISSSRRLEAFEPLKTYGKAINDDLSTHRILRSVLEFSRGDLQGINPMDILTVMGNRLQELIVFDAAVFYVADLRHGIVVANHVVGRASGGLRNLSLSLEHKLSGWAAANNQSLWNLPCFPDFKENPELGKTFELCAVAPMNYNGTIIGAVTLYREQPTKFTENEFRKLELVASQAAVALTRCQDMMRRAAEGLVDPATGLPNAQQLQLIFDQVVVDARRCSYSFAILIVTTANCGTKRPFTNDILAVKCFGQHLRQTDVLVRYSERQFVMVLPRINFAETDELAARLRYDLQHFEQGEEPSTVEIGFSFFPQDGADLETLISKAHSSMHSDEESSSRIDYPVRALQDH